MLKFSRSILRYAVVPLFAGHSEVDPIDLAKSDKIPKSQIDFVPQKSQERCQLYPDINFQFQIRSQLLKLRFFL